MLQQDIDLKHSDLRALSSADGVAGFFLSLGYNVERIEQTPAALGITAASLVRQIDHIERIATQDDWLQIYLFEMKSLRVSDRQALGRALRNRSGDFLLVITTPEYESLDFALLERVRPEQEGTVFARKQDIVRPRVLTVNRSNPSLVALRVLRRFTLTEEDAFYQFDKLLSAYTVAEWSEPLFNNRALFSDYYLNQRLLDSDEWHEDPTRIYQSLRELFVNVRTRLGQSDEADTQEQLLEPALKLLGFLCKRVVSVSGEPVPDYSLHHPGVDESARPLALCLAYRWSRFLDGRDDKDNVRGDENPGARVVSLLESGEAPYIILTNGKVWRLYSAGAHSRATNYFEIDLEETLALLSSNIPREEAIRYFWLFFRVKAFIPEEVHREGEVRLLSFLDRVLEDSETYAKELGERLKERVFEDIFPHFAEGFIKSIRNSEGKEVSIDQDRLDLIYQGTLTFLYRLMFLLYAEARDLLPVKEERGFWQISLQRIVKEIDGHGGTIVDEAPECLRQHYGDTSTELYERLKALFGVIDKGDKTRNVPRYNGGLFITEPEADNESMEDRTAKFLCDTAIPDSFLALGLDRLARDVDPKRQDLVIIDFKSLGVRQLGSIYEGLLEFKLRIATEKMAIVKGKRTEEVVPYGKTKKKILTKGQGQNKRERVLRKDAVYLENTRQERKATGSYYTPDYIVNYIVEHTVGPVLKEKFEELRPRLRETEKAYLQHKRNLDVKRKSGSKPEDPEEFWSRDDMQQLAYDVLDIKILDPAMGSGHFLVEAVDTITDKTLDFLNGFPQNPVRASLSRTRQAILDAMEDQEVSIDQNRLNDVNLLKRQVLKRCVYGVDLNPMAVELAKVSLWLDAFTLGAPLSFLDHHLRPGNSLIGTTAREANAELAEMGASAGQMTFLEGPFRGLLKSAEIMRGIGMLADATIQQAQESADLFHSFEEAAMPYKRLLDVYVMRDFGVKRADEFLRLHGAEVMDLDPDVVSAPYDEVIKKRREMYARFRFFHWDLEFPEVFIDLIHADWKSDAGFDAVVGNPPYDELSEHALGRPIEEKEFLSTTQTFEPTQRSSGRLNWYHFFMVLGIELLRDNGQCSYIVPMTWMGDSFTAGVRKWILGNHLPTVIEAFPQKDDPYERVFFDAKLSTSLYIAQRSRVDGEIAVRVHPGREIQETEHYNVDLPSLVRLSPETWLVPLVSPEGWQILHKITTDPKLGVLAEEGAKPTSGEIIFNNATRPYLTLDDSYELVLRGSHVQRYEMEKKARQGHPIYLNTEEYLASSGESTKAYAHQHSRVVYQEGSAIDAWRRVVTTFLPAGQICGHKICYFVDYKIDQFALLGIFASKLVNWLVEALSVTNSLPAYLIGNLPFPKFHFEIPVEDRKASCSTLLDDYNEGHFEEVIATVSELLSNNRNDVVHDLLSSQAKTMVELNKQKQSEVERFISWLEDRIGTRIDDLAGKTIIGGYLGDYQKNEEYLEVDELIERLHQNKSRIRCTLDAAFENMLKNEYQASLNKLLPIKRCLAETDRLIDQVVYRQYGLTDEEIAIVENRA